MGQAQSTQKKEVKATVKLITEIKENVAKIGQLYSKILSSPVPDQDAQNEIQSLTTNIQSSSKVIKSKLGEVKKMGEMNGGKGNNYTKLLESYMDTMNDLEKRQKIYHDRCKARLKRQLDITGSIEFTEAQLDKMVQHRGSWSWELVTNTEQGRALLSEIDEAKKIKN